MSETSSIKNKAFSGIAWKLAERFLAQLVSMVVSIILARILLPEDYSVVSIISIFFVFCNIFISGGFNTALIQKKNADMDDYSSVLWVSLGISAFLYAVMFFIAPLLASKFANPLLIPVVRVMSLTMFISAYKGVLCAKISNDLMFKKFFISTIVGTVISAGVGIGMAMKGFGPWALVAQQMTNSFIDTVVLTVTTRVKFKLCISFQRLKTLFDYGWKIFVSSIITVIYDEIKPLIVGFKFSAVDLAFYSKGKSFPNIIDSSINSSISAVLFPVISKFQDSREMALTVTRKFMQISSYIVFPVLIGFFVISDNFVIFLLTEKWLPAAPYIRIFCVSYLFNIIQTGNLQAIRALGRSDIVLKLEIIKKSLFFIIILLFVLFDSPYMLALSGTLCSLSASLINAYPNRKLLGYGYGKQMLDLLPNIAASVGMGVIVYWVGYLNTPVFVTLMLQIILGIISYVLLGIVFKNSSFYYLLDFIVKKSGGKKHA